MLTLYRAAKIGKNIESSKLSAKKIIKRRILLYSHEEIEFQLQALQYKLQDVKYTLQVVQYRLQSVKWKKVSLLNKSFSYYSIIEF